MKYDHSAFTQEQLNKEDISQYRRELRGKPNIRNHYNLYLQEKYLKSIIFMLEIRQIAESSKAILDVRAIKGKGKPHPPTNFRAASRNSFRKLHYQKKCSYPQETSDAD